MEDIVSAEEFILSVNSEQGPQKQTQVYAVCVQLQVKPIFVMHQDYRMFLKCPDISSGSVALNPVPTTKETTFTLDSLRCLVFAVSIFRSTHLSTFSILS